MKQKIFTFTLKCLFSVFGYIPTKVLLLMGYLTGFFLKNIICFKKKTVIANLNRVYGDRGKWPKNILRDIYRHFGVLLVEILKMPSLQGDNFNKRFHVHGREHLDQALAQNKGVIVITGHTGNWEYGIAGLTSFGYPMNVIVKKLKNVDNEFLFEKLRGVKGVGFILKENAVLNIAKALKKNKVVVMVIDQNSKRSEGVFVEHFGTPASTYAAPYVLANRFKSPIIPIYSYRDKNFIDHHIEISPAIELINIEEDNDKNLQANIQLLIKSFEEFLLQHPEQWIWMHQRWRSQPTYEILTETE